MKINTIISSGMAVILLFLCSFAFAHILPEDPTIGGQLLATKGCVKCHSLKGEGGKIGPDLGKVDLGDSQSELAAKMWNPYSFYDCRNGKSRDCKTYFDGSGINRDYSVSVFSKIL